MAPRLTDLQKKQITADYVQLGSYSAVARLHGVSRDSVKRAVAGCADFAQKARQKKEQEAAGILNYMESQRKDVCRVLGLCLGELKRAERYARSSPQQIATTMAILIDKYGAFAPPQDGPGEDGLSRSLRELAEGLKSDG